MKPGNSSLRKSGHFEVREATRSDKRALVQLCKRSVSHDYVPMFLDDFLKEGGLFIALDGGKVIGMAKYTRCPGGDGWLGAGRTDPGYRRRGIASAVVRVCLHQAALQGARFVRLWSNRSNKPALIAFRSMGFKEVGSFVRVMKRVRRPAKSSLERERDAQSVLSLLRKSPLMKESKDYAATGNRFVKMNTNSVTELANAGKIYRTGDGLCWIEDRAWGDVWRGVMEFSLLAGEPTTTLEEVELYTRQRGYRELHVYIPSRSRTLRTVRKLGFRTVRWGSDVVLFERAVRFKLA